MIELALQQISSATPSFKPLHPVYISLKKLSLDIFQWTFPTRTPPSSPPTWQRAAVTPQTMSSTSVLEEVQASCLCSQEQHTGARGQRLVSRPLDQTLGLSNLWPGWTGPQQLISSKGWKQSKPGSEPDSLLSTKLRELGSAGDVSFTSPGYVMLYVLSSWRSIFWKCDSDKNKFIFISLAK